MKISNIRKLTLSSVFCMALLTVNHANAAMVQFSLDGEVTTAASGNTFGLSVGNTVTATGTYDDSVIGTGTVFVNFSLITNNMQINIGNTVYTDAMDTISGPSLYFVGGVFDGLDYEAIDGTYTSWGVLGGTDPAGNILEDFTGSGIGGNWIASSFTVTAVPVPAAVWLFTSGMLLLGGIARRKLK